MSDSWRRGSHAVRRQWLDLVARRRRWAVAALAGLAVAAALQAVAPRPPATERVWVAARALPGGRPLARGDLTLVAMPRPLVPVGALSGAASPAGRLLAAPVDRGEPLTGRRLLGADLLQAAAPGAVAVAVHVSDGSQLTGLVHAGDRVDVYAAQPSATGTGPGSARRVVTAVPVLAVPGAQSNGGGSVIVAVAPEAAAALSAAASGAALSVAVTPALPSPSDSG